MKKGADDSAQEALTDTSSATKKFAETATVTTERAIEVLAALITRSAVKDEVMSMYSAVSLLVKLLVNSPRALILLIYCLPRYALDQGVARMALKNSPRLGYAEGKALLLMVSLSST